MNENIYLEDIMKRKQKTKNVGLTSAPFIALTLPGSKKEN